jgi:hypothetical protein
MGFGGGDDSSITNTKSKNGKDSDQSRDPLDFLKKSEVEKKKREEQKLQQAHDKSSKYKSVSELEYALTGYSGFHSHYDYNMGAVLPSSIRQQIKAVYKEEGVT